MPNYTSIARLSLIGACHLIGLTGCQGGLIKGQPSLVLKDYFEGPDSQELDLLFVIDNSLTMMEEQQLLAESVPEMYDALYENNVDLHVGAVSTDMVDAEQSGRLWGFGDGYYIDDSVEDPAGTLADLLRMGTDGDYYERGRWAAYSAIERLGNTVNQGFYRPDAKLAIITVSDEEDSSGSALSGLEALELGVFIDWLEQLKPHAEDVSYSVIVTPPEGCMTGASAGLEYLAVSRAVGGVVWSICEPEYESALTQVADLMRINSVPFHLTQPPIEDTLRVFVNDVELPSDAFRYFADEQVVRIYTDHQPVLDSDEVRVEYEPRGR